MGSQELQQRLPAQSKALCPPRAFVSDLPLCRFISPFGAVAPPANGGQDQQCATLVSLGCCLPGGSAQERPLLSDGKGKRSISDGLERRSVHKESAGAVGLEGMS